MAAAPVPRKRTRMVSMVMPQFRVPAIRQNAPSPESRFRCQSFASHDRRIGERGAVCGMAVPEDMSRTPSCAPGGWRLEHRYAALPASLHVAVEPTPVRAPNLVILNRPLAEALGLDVDTLTGNAGAEIFGGNRLPPGAAPIAQAYAGHQFGHFTPLGDGRAILLGEQITPDGRRFDVQLKGAGRTPFSRNGDGRAALGPMLREYIISEAMHALRIPTTRSLAVVSSGEAVWRHRPLPGAVLTRIASSHIRVGTFEWLAARGDEDALRALIAHTIERHYPELTEADNPALALLTAAIDRQAGLIAQWMQAGFVHGVMNTDNMALSGETIDYGPCAFIDAYDPATVFSSIDRHGRYAYGNQPAMAEWNLTRLAEALLSQLHPDPDQAVSLATETLEIFPVRFGHYWHRGMARKLGLFNEEAADASLIGSLLAWMEKQKVDFTNTFRTLSSGELQDEKLLADREFLDWHEQWTWRRSRQPQSLDDSLQSMRTHNPAFIPRNSKVEEALVAAEEEDDLTIMESLLEVLSTPYDHDLDRPEYTLPRAPNEGVYQTFCGT